MIHRLTPLKRVIFALIAVAIFTNPLYPIAYMQGQLNAQSQPANQENAMLYEAFNALLRGRREVTNTPLACVYGSNVGNSDLKDRVKLKPELTASDYRSANAELMRDPNHFVNVPATLFGDGFGDLTCETALELYIDHAYSGANMLEKRQAFIREYYNTNEQPYTLKVDDARSKLKNAISSKILELSSSTGLTNWRDRIISQAFNICFKWKNPAITITSANKFNKDNWEKENGGNKSVGYMAESAIEGEYVDGVTTCDKIRDFIFDNPANHYIMSYGEDALQDDLNQLEDAQKIEDIKAEFATDSNAFLFCVNSTPGTEEFRNLPTSTQHSVMATYMVGGNEAQGAGVLNAFAARALADCLHSTTQFGDTITEVLERQPPSAERTDAETSEDEGDACYDSVEPLFSVGPLKVPNPLKWIVCGVSQLFAGLLNYATSVVQSLLHFDPTTEKEQGGELKKVWGAILNVANILFVIAFLIMVLSTILDLGLFSNYTVKKLLPRIILSAILANLSWEICVIIINVTNAIGGATREVILSPLEGTVVSGDLQSAAGTIVGENAEAVATAAIGGLVYTLLAGAGAVLLPVMATITLGALVAIFVLLVRRIVIILLIVLAPLALVLFALPGGENLAKRWWKTFTQMMMMYPIIMGLFASGIFISGIFGLSNNTDLVSQLIQIIVLFMPFFVLPMVFKMAGGALANVTGMINDRSKGLVDRTKKWGAEKKHENFENLQAGNRWKGGQADVDGKPTNVRGRLNRGLQTASLVKNAGIRPSRMRGNIESARGTTDLQAARELMEKNETFKNLAADDDKLWALMMGGDDINKVKEVLQKRAPGRFNEETDPLTLNSAAAEVLRVRREAGGRASLMAATMAQAGTGTGFNYGNKGGYNDDMYDAIARASGGDRNLAGMMLGQMRPALKNSGRMEFSGGYANQAKILGRRMDAMSTSDDMINIGGQMVKYDQEQAMRDTTRDAWNSNAGAFIAGKKRTVEMAAPMITEDIRAAGTVHGDEGESFVREIASLAGKYDAAGQVAPQNAEALYNGVLTQSIDLGSISPEARARLGVTDDDDIKEMTIQQAMQRLNGDDKFRGTRKEYGLSAEEQAKAAQYSASGARPDPGTGPQQPTY